MIGDDLDAIRDFADYCWGSDPSSRIYVVLSISWPGDDGEPDEAYAFNNALYDGLILPGLQLLMSEFGAQALAPLDNLLMLGVSIPESLNENPTIASSLFDRMRDSVCQLTGIENTNRPLAFHMGGDVIFVQLETIVVDASTTPITVEEVINHYTSEFIHRQSLYTNYESVNRWPVLEGQTPFQRGRQASWGMSELTHTFRQDNGNGLSNVC